MNAKEIQTLKDLFDYEQNERYGEVRIKALRNFMIATLPNPTIIYNASRRTNAYYDMLRFVKIAKYGDRGCIEGGRYTYGSNHMFAHALSELQKIFIRFNDYQLSLDLWYNIIEILTMLIGDENMRYDRLIFNKKIMRKYYSKFKDTDKPEVKSKMNAKLNKSLYELTMDQIRGMSIGTNKKEFYDYSIKMLANDLKFDFLANVFYGEDVTNYFTDNIFPRFFKDANNDEVRLNISNSIKKIAIDEVASSTYSKEKIHKNFPLRKKSFKQEENYHYYLYYPQIDFCHSSYDGHHSTAIGVANKHGDVEAKVVCMIPLFENVYTDGAYWYSKHDKSKLKGDCGEVKDFRFAILFELARRIYFKEY